MAYLICLIKVAFHYWLFFKSALFC